MSMSGGLWSYNRFESYEKRLEEEKKSLANKCDPKGKITRRDVIAGATGDCGDGKKVNEEKKELPDFIKDKMKDGHKKEHEKDDKKKSKKDDDCECKEEVELEEGSCGGKGYQMGGKVGYQKGGEVKPKKIVKEDVLEYMLENGLANNAVSAEVIFNHISDEFLESIEESIMESDYPMRDAMNAAGMNRAPKAAPIKPTPKKPTTSLPKKGMA